MMRTVFVSLLFAMSACALDAADQPEPGQAEPGEVEPGQPDPDEELMLAPDLAVQGDEEPAEAIEGPEAELSCSYMNTGAWGCYGDNWCDSRCQTRGDSDFGWLDHCIHRPNHWETVCVCCDL